MQLFFKNIFFFLRPGNQSKFSSIAIILGAIFGCIVALIPCVALIICCVTPCCLIHKKCQERRNQRNQSMLQFSQWKVMVTVEGKVLCVTPHQTIFQTKLNLWIYPAVITTVIGAPLQPPTPSGHQPSHPGYQPEPVQPGFGDYPMPSAPPPSYQEASKFFPDIVNIGYYGKLDCWEECSIKFTYIKLLGVTLKAAYCTLKLQHVSSLM